MYCCKCACGSRPSLCLLPALSVLPTALRTKRPNMVGLHGLLCFVHRKAAYVLFAAFIFYFWNRGHASILSCVPCQRGISLSVEKRRPVFVCVLQRRRRPLKKNTLRFTLYTAFCYIKLLLISGRGDCIPNMCRARCYVL